MAVKAQFEGWIKEVKPQSWGAFVTVSHAHRRLNEATGEWETTETEYIDVSVQAEDLPGIEGAELVSVIGNERVEAYLSNEGLPKARRKIRATSIVRVERAPRSDAPAASQAPRTEWSDAQSGVESILGGVPTDEAPF